MSDEELVNKLAEDHKDDVQEPEEIIDDKNNDSGGDNDQDNSTNEADGDNDTDKDSKSEHDDTEDEEKGDDSQENKDESTESDDSDQQETKSVGEKKDANSRIRQLNEEKKAILAEKEALSKKLFEQEEEARKAKELEEDPVYTINDFLGSLDEKGEPLTDGEATARFRAWEADYKLRQFQKQQVLKEEQAALISLQKETNEAFTKFPEFNSDSDNFDPELANLANEAFKAGLIYKEGHDGDENYIIGSHINPGELLEKLHNIRNSGSNVTKVNNLGDNNGDIINSQQVNKKQNTYAPNFRGDVDREIDKLISERNKK